MSGTLTIRQARLVLPDRIVTGDLLIEDGVIAEIGPSVARTAGETVDGAGLTVLPGVVDTHVHLKDLARGSKAAAAGGVTAFLDARSTCVSPQALETRLDNAAAASVVHYGFFIRATRDNLDQLNAAERACAVHVSIDDGPNSLLSESAEALDTLFAQTEKLIAVHAEDGQRIRERLHLYAESTDPRDHPRLRDAQSAAEGCARMVELANKYGRKLHLLHLSSVEELDILKGLPPGHWTATLCPQNVLLTAEKAYERLGPRALCNPPIRTARHASALWQGLMDGLIDGIATDHRPMPPERKDLPYPATPPGMPNMEWTLPLLLDARAKDRCTLHQIARWTSEGPANCYRIPRKGRLETGYDGDLVLVDLEETRVIQDEDTRSPAGWSPWQGRTVQGWPTMTIVRGEIVYRNGQIVSGVRGRALTYTRT
jgi:dihydroorotase